MNINIEENDPLVAPLQPWVPLIHRVNTPPPIRNFPIFDHEQPIPPQIVMRGHHPYVRLDFLDDDGDPMPTKYVFAPEAYDPDALPGERWNNAQNVIEDIEFDAFHVHNMPERAPFITDPTSIVPYAPNQITVPVLGPLRGETAQPLRHPMNTPTIPAFRSEEEALEYNTDEIEHKFLPMQVHPHTFVTGNYRFRDQYTPLSAIDRDINLLNAKRYLETKTFFEERLEAIDRIVNETFTEEQLNQMDAAYEKGHNWMRDEIDKKYKSAHEYVHEKFDLWRTSINQRYGTEIGAHQAYAQMAYVQRRKYINQSTRDLETYHVNHILPISIARRTLDANQQLRALDEMFELHKARVSDWESHIPPGKEHLFRSSIKRTNSQR